MISANATQQIRLLAIIEATTVTGPAKNLLEFCRVAKSLETGAVLDVSLLMFSRMARGEPATCPNEFIREAERAGVRVQSIPERFTYDLRLISELKKAVDEVASDIIQTHGMKSNLLVRLSGVHRGRVWVAFHHGYTSTTHTRELLAHLDPWSLQAPAQVVTVSEAFARQLSGRGVSRDRIMVLHNAIHPDWLWNPSDSRQSAMQDAAPIKPAGERLVLTVGRLSKEKGLLDLVAAVECLKKMQPALPIRVAIVGEGRERKSIEDAVCRSGLENQIHLVGQVSDVRPYYRVADIVAISSFSEGSPNVLLEAMAAGVPVVATAVGGIPEIVRHGETAWLVPPHEPAALAAAINRLLVDRALCESLSGRARDVVRQRHSPLSRTRCLVSLYQQLCCRKPTGLQPVSRLTSADPAAMGDTVMPSDPSTLSYVEPRP